MRSIISLHVFRYLHVYLHVFTWYLLTSRKHTRRGELQFAHPYGWICNMGEFAIWVNLKHGRNTMWANWGMGDLQYGRISIRPYDPRKRIHTMPVMSFFVYLYIFTWYLRTFRKHTRRGELQFALSCMRAIRALLYESNSPTKPTKGIGNKKVKNYHSNSSLFTLHFSLIIVSSFPCAFSSSISASL